MGSSAYVSCNAADCLFAFTVKIVPYAILQVFAAGRLELGNMRRYVLIGHVVIRTVS